MSRRTRRSPTPDALDLLHWLQDEANYIRTYPSTGREAWLLIWYFIHARRGDRRVWPVPQIAGLPGVRPQLPVATVGVDSIRADASPALTGAVTLVSGSGITLSEVGQTITVAASGGGGGTTIYTPDDLTQFNAVYGAALSYDYNADDSGTSPPAGWSWVNQGTSTLRRAFNRLIIAPQTGDAAGENHRILVRSLPTESTWRAFIKMPMSADSTFWDRAGFILRDSGTGKYVYFGPAASSSSNMILQMHLDEWSALNTFSAVLREAAMYPAYPSYLSIRRNSATSYDYMHSFDGIAWGFWDNARNTSAFFTPNQIGVLVNAPGNSGEAALQFFRVR